MAIHGFSRTKHTYIHTYRKLYLYRVVILVSHYPFLKRNCATVLILYAMHCICFNSGVDIFGFIESNQISLVIIWGRHYFHNYLWILPVWLWDLLRQLLGLNTFWFCWFNSWAVFTFIGSKCNKRLTERCSDEGILYRSPKECAVVSRQYVCFLFLLLLHCFASAAFVLYQVMQCNGASWQL